MSSCKDNILLSQQKTTDIPKSKVYIYTGIATFWPDFAAAYPDQQSQQGVK